MLPRRAPVTPTAMDPGLLEEIPYADDILPGLPPALKTRLLAAFDITVFWNKPGSQATVRTTRPWCLWGLWDTP
jgi:hypothetical protein